MNWFQTGKTVHQGCISSPCLFNLHEGYITIELPSRKINNLRYADDTILMARSEEELKNLLRKTKEESEKAG